MHTAVSADFFLFSFCLVGRNIEFWIMIMIIITININNTNSNKKWILNNNNNNNNNNDNDDSNNNNNNNDNNNTKSFFVWTFFLWYMWNIHIKKKQLDCFTFHFIVEVLLWVKGSVVYTSRNWSVFPNSLFLCTLSVYF